MGWDGRGYDSIMYRMGWDGRGIVLSLLFVSEHTPPPTS
jgi:hypothetical protein